MEPLPTFPLFADPVGEGVFKQSQEKCDVCKRARGWVYDEQVYGPESVSDLVICPWCIADGSAGRLGAVFNDSEVFSSSAPEEGLSPEDRELVEQRTPGFTTWQGNHWMMCCGRACVYLGRAESEDLRGRWADAVESMFEDDELSEEEQEEIVDSISRDGSPSAYVFQCRVCKGHRAYWDAD